MPQMEKPRKIFFPRFEGGPPPGPPNSFLGGGRGGAPGVSNNRPPGRGGKKQNKNFFLSINCFFGVGPLAPPLFFLLFFGPGGKMWIFLFLVFFFLRLLQIFPMWKNLKRVSPAPPGLPPFFGFPFLGQFEKPVRPPFPWNFFLDIGKREWFWGGKNGLWGFLLLSCLWVLCSGGGFIWGKKKSFCFLAPSFMASFVLDKMFFPGTNYFPRARNPPWKENLKKAFN